MKDSQIPILLIRSFFYRGKAAYFWLPVTRKKGGKCAYKEYSIFLWSALFATH